MVYGQTQIYLLEVEGARVAAQAACRVWELRGFEVLSVCPGFYRPNETTYLITMRASSTLYVNWLMNNTLYQAGPYDGQAEADEAERTIIMLYGLDVVKDSYVTAQRDHERTFMGTPR